MKGWVGLETHSGLKSQRSRSQKQCRRGSLHSCECCLLLVLSVFASGHLHNTHQELTRHLYVDKGVGYFLCPVSYRDSRSSELNCYILVLFQLGLPYVRVYPYTSSFWASVQAPGRVFENRRFVHVFDPIRKYIWTLPIAKAYNGTW